MTVHKGIYYTCNLCDHKSKRKTHLKEHIARIHGAESEDFQCTDCGFQGKSKEGLAHHTRLKHSGNIYKCEDCDYQSDKNANLLRHINVKHKGIRYDCTYCDYKATDKGNLKRHIKIHKGI